MRTLLASVGAALLLTIAMAGVASAHTATSDCETVTLTGTPEGVTADLLDGGTVVLADVGDGTYQVPAGSYVVRWSDETEQELTVGACPTPTKPAPSQPIPTPPPTDTVYMPVNDQPLPVLPIVAFVALAMASLVLTLRRADR